MDLTRLQLSVASIVRSVEVNGFRACIVELPDALLGLNVMVIVDYAPWYLDCTHLQICICSMWLGRSVHVLMQLNKHTPFTFYVLKIGVL
jgi:hypothetical protein